jgi:DeoR family glycerol-3-phosphate regulon repressor
MASRTQLNASSKTRIALALAAQIPDGSSLFLDNGSSTFALAQALHARMDLMVYTNDFAIAQQIALNCRESIMLGGKVDTQEMATIGIKWRRSASKQPYRSANITLILQW